MFIRTFCSLHGANEGSSHCSVFVKRPFVNLTPALFLQVSYTPVRLNLEDFIDTTFPYLEKDIYHTKRVQRLTRTVKRNPQHKIPLLQRLKLIFFERTKTESLSNLRLWICLQKVSPSLLWISHTTVLFTNFALQSEVVSSLEKTAFSVCIFEKWNKSTTHTQNSHSMAISKNQLESTFDVIDLHVSHGLVQFAFGLSFPVECISSPGYLSMYLIWSKTLFPF